jgi:hypothetical protein
MPLTVELPASLEKRVRERAARVGDAPETMIADLVRDQFSVEAIVPELLTEEETKWLKQAMEVPSPRVRERWRELAALRKSGKLDENQQAEMVLLYDEIEANHARRIAAAVELAKLWQVSLDSIISQLGLSPTDDGDTPSD